MYNIKREIKFHFSQYINEFTDVSRRIIAIIFNLQLKQ